ncbi:MAG TPA: MFS transporter, partial [Cyclobacteriaceae bacterium]
MQSTAVTPSEKKNLWSVITASSVGTLIEWYDFYIFGSLAITISTQFFPSEHPTAAFLSTLAAFAVGFVVRPFGALVFGRLGDMIGRKYTFLLTLIIMGTSTFLIGLVPSYKTIGLAAPFIVVLLRLLQGLALGGEYGGAATYVAEHSPAAKRGFYTGFIQTTASLGFFVSLAVILLVRLNLSEEAFESWGWRLPFLFSVFLVAISIYIRLRMKESPLFARLKASGQVSRNPIRESFGKKENLRFVLIALFGATAGQGVVWYTGQFYALSFIQKTCNIEFVQSYYILAVALLLGTPLFIYFGWLSDKIGRKAIMMAGLLFAVVLYRPIYQRMYDLADTSAKTVLSETNGQEENGAQFRTLTYSDGSAMKATMVAESVTREVTLGTTGFWAMVLLI